MTILENIKREQKQARQNIQKHRATVLSTLMAEISIVGKNAQMGQIMGYFSKNFKGQYDGKMLSALVREVL